MRDVGPYYVHAHKEYIERTHRGKSSKKLCIQRLAHTSPGNSGNGCIVQTRRFPSMLGNLNTVFQVNEYDNKHAATQCNTVILVMASTRKQTFATCN